MCKQMIIEKKCYKKWLKQWAIENIVIVIRDLQMNQILALNNMLGVDMLLNK